MMSQLTLAAVVVAVLVVPYGVALALTLPVAVELGHGAADAGLAGVAVVGAVAAVVWVAVPAAAVVGDAVLPVPCCPWWPWPAVLAGLAGITYAAGEAQLAFAASVRLLRPEWSTTATIAATTTISATGMATGTARRASPDLSRGLMAAAGGRLAGW
jgi:hypothetical protein